MEMAQGHTLVVYGGSPRGDASLRDATRVARRRGGRLSVVALAPVEPEHSRCCDMRSVMWNGIQRELAESDLSRARLAVEDDAAVDLHVLGYLGLGAADAIASRAADLGAERIVLADAGAAGLGRWARRRLRRRSEVPVCEEA
jgi:nucleotide-binding universal stress UspA family protein